MDYEKKYKEALERARKLQENSNGMILKKWLWNIFPELKESKGERIMKVIRGWIYTRPASFFDNGISKEEILAWLEKQGEQKPYGQRKECLDCQFNYAGECKGSCQMKRGEQKPTDKVELKFHEGEQKSDSFCREHCKGFQETGKCFADGDCKAKREAESNDKNEPKFHEGDWVIYNNDICQIVKREEGCNILVTQFGVEKEPINERNLSTAKLWDISDAKNGDVLFHSDSASNGIFIFKEIIDKGFAKEVISYCDYDSEDHFCLGEDHTCCWSDAKILYPATKEQRDLLFSKIKEAGYEWDSKKKELKIIDWSKHIKYETNSPSIIEENTKWSEEDEDHLNSLIELLPGLTIRHNWLKSLKDRIQHQPKQEWSDEDEYMLDETIQHLKQLIEIDKAKHCACDVQYYQRDIDWLKSLRPHKQWKPSEEQIKAFEHFVRSIGESGYASPYENNTKFLYSLLEQLKKL